jgi:hypothetical protein
LFVFFGRFRQIPSNCRPVQPLPSSPPRPHPRYDILASRSFPDTACTALHCCRAFPPSSHQPIVTNRPSLATELYISYPRNSSFCLVSYNYLVIHRLPAQIRYSTDGRARFNFLCWTILPEAIALAAVPALPWPDRV